MLLLGPTAQQKPQRHGLNMELDLQSLFGLHVHSCTHWLRSRIPHSHRIWTHRRLRYWSAKIERRHHFMTSGGQISTKHLKTSIRPFFATCRLPQYPEFWRCYRPRHTFLGPHCKRSLKSLDTMLKVPMRNTQLLPLPRKMVAVVLNIFFGGVYMFFI